MEERLIAARVGCIESRRPGARERGGIQAAFDKRQGRVPLGCAQLRIGYRPINERAHARLALERSTASPSLSLSLYPSTGCARSFNSCTPPENRFHECKSPSPTVRGESERRSVHTRVSMRRCLPAQDRERKESVQNGQVVSAVYWIS